MKIVKENINFERGMNPKEAMGIGLYQSLKDKGVRFWFTYTDGEIEEAKVLKNISEISRVVNKLIKLGVDPTEMEISRDFDISVAGWDVSRSNHVIHCCLTEDDAKSLINVLKHIEGAESAWNYSKGSTLSGLRIDFKNIDWLDKLEEYRKKLRNL